MDSTIIPITIFIVTFLLLFIFIVNYCHYNQYHYYVVIVANDIASSVI